MTFDFRKLRGLMVEKEITQDEIAKNIGISSSSLSQKLNNKVEFSSSEIYKTCDLLGISHSLISEYFFKVKV